MIQIGESYKKKKLRKMNPTQIIAFKYDANVRVTFGVLHGGNLSMCCTHTEIETIAIHKQLQGVKRLKLALFPES